MIKHIVFFGIEEFAEGKSKQELARYIKQELENLKNLIPELISIEVGINHPDAHADNFDIALYTEFKDMADLELYANHPEHKRVGSFIGKVKTSRACVDYEV